MGIHVFYGNEPYSIDFYRKKYENMVVNKELNLMIFDAWSEDVSSYLMTYPIMEEKKVVIISCSLKDLGTAFNKYLKNPCQTTELVLILKDLDKRNAIYKKLQKEGAVTECNKIQDSQKLQNLLLKEVAKNGARISQSAYRLFVEKENYLEREDITLYNLFSDIERLAKYSTDITEETVNLLIPDNLSKKMYGIAKMLVSGDHTGLVRQAQVLSSNTMETLGALLREYRIAYKAKYFSLNQIGIKYPPVFSRLPQNILIGGMDIVLSSIDGIKRGTLTEGQALSYTFAKLAHLHASNRA